MPNHKKVNWNTLLLSVGFTATVSLTGFLGKELYKEVRNTHDEILTIKLQIVPRAEYESKLAEIRTRLGEIEIDIQKLKDRRQ